jgi:hypothetical protein
MLTRNLPLTMSFVWVVVVSNLITVAICFLFIQQIAKITFVRAGVLIPPIILLAIILAAVLAPLLQPWFSRLLARRLPLSKDRVEVFAADEP